MKNFCFSKFFKNFFRFLWFNAKKNYIGNVHYSFGSIFKTFWKVFGIPYLNQYDVSATDLSDLFTNTPDFSPFNALPADKRIFDPQKALDPFDEKFDWKAFNESEELDRTETMQKRRAEDDKHEKNNWGLVFGCNYFHNEVFIMFESYLSLLFFQFKNFMPIEKRFGVGLFEFV